MTDARIVRTRASLHTAILELSSQKPVTEITVSELAAAADINRVTFYKHYGSPAEALREALHAELDESRAALLACKEEGRCNSFDDLMASVDMVLEHLTRYRRLYEISMSDLDSGAVPWVLTQHFTATIRMYLEMRGAEIRQHQEFDTEIIAGYVGAGLVGAIYAWLRSDSTDCIQLRENLAALTPTWWFPTTS